MSKLWMVATIVFSLVAGFGGGWVYEMTLGKGTNSTTATPTVTNSSTSSATTSASTQTLEECLTEAWGADKYAAISANSSLATTEDNLAALKCYK